MNLSPSPSRALGGIWRLTVRQFLQPAHWLTVGAMVAILALLSLPALSHAAGDRRGPYLSWIAHIDHFYLTFLIPIIAFISGAGALRDDLKPGAVDYLFTRPVRRWTYIGLRYLVQLACIQGGYLLALGVLIALGMCRHVPHLLPAVPLLLLAQVLMTAVFTAFGFLCAILTSRYIVIGLIYAFIVEAGVGRIPTELNRLSMTHDVRAMLEALAASPAPPGQGVLLVTATLLAVSALMVAATAVIFSVKELAGGQGSDA